MNAKTIILLTLFVLVPAPQSVRAQNAVGPGVLPVGSWWTMMYTRHSSTSGDRNYQGTDTYDLTGTETFTVTLQSTTSISVREQVTGPWSETAQGSYWTRHLGGTSKRGIYSTDNIYTIDLSSMKITAVTDTVDFGALVDNTAWFLIRPDPWTAGPQPGGWTVTRPQTVTAFGTNIGTLTLFHSGSSERVSYVYDVTYGILLSESWSGTNAVTHNDGDVTTNFSVTAQATSTNINFPGQTQTSETQVTSAANNESLLAVPLVQALIIAIIVGSSIVLSIVLLSRRGRGAVKQQEQRRCKNCRSVLPDDAVFCGECGHPIGD